MKIYTKTGDDGTTGLLGGRRVPKKSPRIIAIGEVDELNAAIGVARAHGGSALDQDLYQIQNWLFDIGGELASPELKAGSHRAITSEQAAFLEGSMDRMTEQLEPLRNFILPGGSLFAAQLHLARAICRRTERHILELDTQEPISDEVKVFLNRLSDWLFLAARTANRLEGVQDVKWGRTGE